MASPYLKIGMTGLVKLCLQGSSWTYLGLLSLRQDKMYKKCRNFSPTFSRLVGFLGLDPFFGAEVPGRKFIPNFA